MTKDVSFVPTTEEAKPCKARQPSRTPNHVVGQQDLATTVHVVLSGSPRYPKEVAGIITEVMDVVTGQCQVMLCHPKGTPVTRNPNYTEIDPVYDAVKKAPNTWHYPED